jgi:hypothetical protein
MDSPRSSDFGGVVYQDHADAAGLLHGQALVRRAVDAALAEHDLAGDLGRIESARALSAAAKQS